MGNRKGNVLFNGARSFFFYLRLYDVGHMAKDHTGATSAIAPRDLFMHNPTRVFLGEFK